MHIPTWIRLLALSLPSCTFAAALQSAEVESGRSQANAQHEAAPGHWTVSATIGVKTAPEIPGGGYQRTQFDGNLTLEQNEGWFLDLKNGAGYQWRLTPSLTIAGLAGVSQGRSEGDHYSQDKTLQGMGDIGRQAQGGVLLSYQKDALKVTFKHLINLNQSQRGQSITLAADYLAWQAPRGEMHLNAALSAGDGDDMQRWFGVSQDQASRSGFAAYQAHGGLKGGALGLGWVQPMSRQWRLLVNLNYVRLLGDAADSPLVYRRHYTQASAGMQYSWQ